MEGPEPEVRGDLPGWGDWNRPQQGPLGWRGLNPARAAAAKVAAVSSACEGRWKVQENRLHRASNGVRGPRRPPPSREQQACARQVRDAPPRVTGPGLGFSRLLLRFG